MNFSCVFGKWRFFEWKESSLAKVSNSEEFEVSATNLDLKSNLVCIIQAIMPATNEITIKKTMIIISMMVIALIILVIIKKLWTNEIYIKYWRIWVQSLIFVTSEQM